MFYGRYTVYKQGETEKDRVSAFLESDCEQKKQKKPSASHVSVCINADEKRRRDKIGRRSKKKKQKKEEEQRTEKHTHTHKCCQLFINAQAKRTQAKEAECSRRTNKRRSVGTRPPINERRAHTSVSSSSCAGNAERSSFICRRKERAEKHTRKKTQMLESRAACKRAYSSRLVLCGVHQLVPQRANYETQCASRPLSQLRHACAAFSIFYTIALQSASLCVHCNRTMSH